MFGFFKNKKQLTIDDLNPEFLQWDDFNNDVEAYDKKRRHLGTVEPESREFYKPVIKGRILLCDDAVSSEYSN